MSSRRARSTRVRTKVVALLLSLVALWSFAAFVTVREGLNLLFVSTLDQGIAQPNEVLLPALQDERRLTLIYLGSNSGGARQAMLAQRAVTDERAAAFVEAAKRGMVQLAASPVLEKRLADTFTLLEGLPAQRVAIDGGRMTRSAAAAAFTTVGDAIFGCLDAISAVDDQAIAKDARTLIKMTRAREVLSREDALLMGALSAGQLTAAEHTQFVELAGTQRFLYGEATAELPDADRTRFEELFRTSAFTNFRALEDQVVAAGAGASPVSPATWEAAIRPVFDGSQQAVLDAGDGVVARAVPVAVAVIIRLALAGVLGLIAVIASIVISITTARKLVRQLERLRNAARDLASYRLPRVVERLQHGERVDVETEAPPLDFGRDEIGQVGEAFNQVQETAVRVAVEQAELRRSVRDVFLSLARRSQALLHRQLSLLDAMERRATDSEELAELFRIDHLATRMRRNAENLIVLSGATAGRAWRKPVPMVDVLRGALAEVEDYTRVTVLPVGSASLLGRSVGDVIHLLAELIENAVSFSPPQTVVRVGGSVVGYGFAIEIEDRGLGMSPEELEAANEQLRNPPEFRLTSTARLGLYVVGKLAERHGIRVRLTESPYGGTTAIVLIPGTLIADDGSEDMNRLESEATDGFRSAQLAGVGRHRLQSDAAFARAEPAAIANAAYAGGADRPGADAPAGNGVSSPSLSGELPLFYQMPDGNGSAAPTPPVIGEVTGLPTRPVPAAPSDPVASPATPVASPATPVETPASPPPTEPPRLTPAGLPWRQRRSSPGEPAPGTSGASTGSGGLAPAQAGPAAPFVEHGADGATGANGGGSGLTPRRGLDASRSLMGSYRSGTLRGRTEAARLAETNQDDPQWTEPSSESAAAAGAPAHTDVTGEPSSTPSTSPPAWSPWMSGTQWTESAVDSRDNDKEG